MDKEQKLTGGWVIQCAMPSWIILVGVVITDTSGCASLTDRFENAPVQHYEQRLVEKPDGGIEVQTWDGTKWKHEYKPGWRD